MNLFSKRIPIPSFSLIPLRTIHTGLKTSPILQNDFKYTTHQEKIETIRYTSPSKHEDGQKGNIEIPPAKWCSQLATSSEEIVMSERDSKNLSFEALQKKTLKRFLRDKTDVTGHNDSKS